MSSPNVVLSPGPDATMPGHEGRAPVGVPEVWRYGAGTALMRSQTKSLWS
jgi:hypothetical protein